MFHMAGVFIGISSMDYNKVTLQHTRAMTAFSSTGASLSVAAGRLAFAFNMRGPAMSVDTGASLMFSLCSSCPMGLGCECSACWACCLLSRAIGAGIQGDVFN